MSKMETLEERVSKANELMLKHEFHSAQMELYSNLCYEIYVLKVTKMLTATAPETMDPQKIHEHWAESKKLLVSIFSNGSTAVKEAVKKGAVYENYLPVSVGSYKESFSRYVKMILKEYFN